MSFDAAQVEASRCPRCRRRRAGSANSWLGQFGTGVLSGPLQVLRGLRALYQFRHEVWYTLSGRRLEELKSSLRREVSDVSRNPYRR